MGNACGKEEEAEVEDTSPKVSTKENPGTLTLLSVKDDSESKLTKRFTFTANPPIRVANTNSCFAIGIVKFGEKDGEEDKTRMYTPAASKNGGKTVELLIKKYDQNAKFGEVIELNMSSYIHSLAKGSTLSYIGPKEKYEYSQNKSKTLGLIAGGSGVTPMLQLVKRILADTLDNTEVILLYGNSMEKDIIARKELEQLAADNEQFTVHWFLTNAPSHPPWQGEYGRIDKNAIVTLLKAGNGPNHKEAVDKSEWIELRVAICGPNSMIDTICGPKQDGEQGPVTGILGGLGFDNDTVYKF